MWPLGGVHAWICSCCGAPRPPETVGVRLPVEGPPPEAEQEMQLQ